MGKLLKSLSEIPNQQGVDRNINRRKQPCLLPAQPRVCFQRGFPFSGGGGNAGSDLEKCVVKPNAVAGSPDGFSCSNEGPQFFFPSVHFIQSKCSH